MFTSQHKFSAKCAPDQVTITVEGPKPTVPVNGTDGHLHQSSFKSATDNHQSSHVCQPTLKHPGFDQIAMLCMGYEPHTMHNKQTVETPQRDICPLHDRRITGTDA